MAQPRKADHIADDLLRRIVSGEHAVGSVLPREAELAAHYGVNRSVLREAIKQLEVHRLVAPVRRRGTLVLDPLRSLTPEVLRAMLMPAPQHIDARVLASFLELRAELDAHMNSLAAQRRTTRDLESLGAVVERLEAARISPRRYVEVAEELSLALARATHNPIFEMLVHWQRHLTRDLEELFLLVRMPSDAHLQGVRALLLALEARDAETARELARAFHAFATPVLLQAVAAYSRPVGARAKQPPVAGRAAPARQATPQSEARTSRTETPGRTRKRGARTPEPQRARSKAKVRRR